MIRAFQRRFHRRSPSASDISPPNAATLSDDDSSSNDPSSSLSSSSSPSYFAEEFYNDDPRLPPPASDEAIVNLPYTLLYAHNRDKLKDGNSLCNVCFDPLSQGIGVSRLPCGHVYHVQCAVAWLSRTCSCPTCRYELPTGAPTKKHPTFEAERVVRMKDRSTVTCSCPPSSMHHVCFFVDDDNNKDDGNNDGNEQHKSKGIETGKEEEVEEGKE